MNLRTVGHDDEVEFLARLQSAARDVVTVVYLVDLDM